jgi:hypothetical protein
MRRSSLRAPSQRSRMTSIAWGLASLLFLFTSENIWIDPWLRNKFRRIPSLVPEALSGTWFLALAVGGIALVLLVVCQILLTRDRNVPFWTKVRMWIAVLIVLLLGVQWIRVTSPLDAFGLRSTHTVKLTWKASTSQVVGYNVYRSKVPTDNYVKINPSLVQGLTFTDDTVEGGTTYYYVARAVDGRGHESSNSNQASAVVP